MKAFRLLLFGLLWLVGTEIHAEGNCPPGYYPIGAPQGQGGPQSCAPIPRDGNDQQQTQPEPLPPQWTTQWGAIATDEPKGILGTATGLPTKSEAQRAAVIDCQARGGTPCKLEIAYDNECVTLAVGTKDYSINTGSTADAASQLAMKSCSSGGDTNCHVYYTACSLPMRIQ